MSVVILEGPDCAGKTTLARHTAFPDYTYFHQGPYTGDPYHQTLDLVGGALRQYEKVLFDRLHLGEQVYGPIYRGVDKLGASRRKLLDGFLRRRKAVVVLCLPHLETALELWRARRDRGEEMLTEEAQYIRVYRAYERLETDLPIVWYDFNISTPEQVRAAVDEIVTVTYGSIK